jgi:hypothetical protein
MNFRKVQPVAVPSRQLLEDGWHLWKSQEIGSVLSRSEGFYPINLRTARNLSLGTYDTCPKLIYGFFTFPPTSLPLSMDVI